MDPDATERTNRHDRHRDPGAQPAPWSGAPTQAVDLYRAELGEPLRDGARAATLLYAIGDLQELTLGDPAAALSSYLEAAAVDAAFMAPLVPLRRLLAARGDWLSLLSLLDQSLQNPSLSLGDKAELWVERGRLLEDRLQRDDEAVASYRAALGSEAAPQDHPAALLALLLWGARTGDVAATEQALAGLARVADAPAQRGALLANLAATQRAAGGDGEGRALRTVGEVLASSDGSGADALLLRQLAALSGAQDPRVRAAALGDLGRRAAAAVPPAPALAAALLREQGRLFRDELSDPLAAFAALREVLTLQPGHPLAAADLVDIADQLNRADLLDDAFDLSAETVDGAPSPLRRDIVLRHAEVLARLGQSAEAVALLQLHPELPASDPRVRVVETVLRARAGDASPLVAAFEGEGERLTGLPGAKAFLRAAAVADGVLGEGERAEALMRRALALAPGYRPAVDALAQRLRPAGRAAELGTLFEGELGSLPAEGPGADPERRRVLLESLVALYRDELREPARAREHQRRLVALAGDGPDAARAWVRLFELELLSALARPDAPAGGGGAAALAAPLLALAADAGDPAQAATLRVEAARLLSSGPTADGDLRRAEELFRQSLAADPTGLAGAGLESLVGRPGNSTAPAGHARADAVAAELAAALARGPSPAARALRFRLALAEATAGRGADALAALRPLRDAGDRLARDISLDLARTSGRLDWEVAVRAEATAAPASPDDALALAEAQERHGDVAAAAAGFRALLATTPTLDAALGALRCATVAPGAPVAELTAPLRAAAALCAGDDALVFALAREANFLTAAAGQTPEATADAPASCSDDASPVDQALWRWMTSARANDAGGIADGLFQLARAAGDRSGSLIPLFSRASARARLGHPDDARRVQVLAWREHPDAPALQQALTDLPITLSSAAQLVGLSSARAARAKAAGGALAQALDFESAVEAESGGRLREALAAFGRVLARDPDCLDAVEGVRRLAHAAGDTLGEARALARLGTLIKGPQARALFLEGARLFDAAGQSDQALALLWRVLEDRPDDETAIVRLTDKLLDDLGAPGRALAYDRLLTHRLSQAAPDHIDRVPLLLARASNRLHRLGDQSQAIQDFKRILKIVPYHEEALGQLAELAVAQPSPPDAIRLLERFVAVSRDPERALRARLQLASAYEAVRDVGRAVEILEQAAHHNPGDPRPRERIVDLLMAAGDWRGALGTLRVWDQATSDPQDKARLYVRIGAVLRDHALDMGGAAQAFRLAADLDPLGEGARALVSLHESLGDAAGRAQVIVREIGDLRQALSVDPLDVARLHRLKEFLDRDAVVPADAAPGTVLSVASDHPLGDAAAPVAQLLALLGEGPEPAGAAPSPRRMGAGLSAAAFWTRLAIPQSEGFPTEIWGLLASTVAQVFPLPPAALARMGLSRGNRVAPGSEPRLGWIEATAAALGIEGLTCYASAQPLGETGDAGVVALELPEPVLVFDRAALAGGAQARFRFGRALALLRLRASVLERLAAGELHNIFLAAGALAGAPQTAAASASSAALLRALGKGLPRKERKALALQSSRFGFETIDTEAWRRAVLGTADRLGLVIAGDVAAAARVAAAGVGPIATAADLRQSAAAIDLLRFSLQAEYLDLRAEAGVAGG